MVGVGVESLLVPFPLALLELLGRSLLIGLQELFRRRLVEVFR